MNEEQAELFPKMTLAEERAEALRQMRAAIGLEFDGVESSFLCFTGTRRRKGELKAAFDLVAPRDNWKMPIDCTLLRSQVDRKLIIDAVHHYTGSTPTFHDVDAEWMRITAPGYWAHQSER
jgi:hypothetical protein